MSGSWRSKVWPKDRPPIATDPLHFRSYAEIEEYLSQPKLRCLECNRYFGKLGAHVTRSHKITVAQYNSKYGLPQGTGLVGTATKAKLAKNAVSNDFPEAGRRALKIYRPGGGRKGRRLMSAYLLEKQRVAALKPRRKGRWSKQIIG
jgi:hypothetical protein